MLLFNFLQEFIFFKDARQLLLKPLQIEIFDQDHLQLVATVGGEQLDIEKHELKVDVKAVTLHQFCVEQTDSGWECFIIVDV